MMRISIPTITCASMLACSLAACDGGQDTSERSLDDIVEVAADVAVRQHDLEVLAATVSEQIDELKQEKLAVEELTFEPSLLRKAELEGKLQDYLVRLNAVTDPPVELEVEFEAIATETVALQHKGLDRLAQPLPLSPAIDSRWRAELQDFGLDDDGQQSEHVDYRAEYAREDRRAACEGAFPAAGSDTRELLRSRARKCAEILRIDVTEAEFDTRRRARLETVRLRVRNLESVLQRIESSRNQLETFRTTILSSYGSAFDKLVKWGVTGLAAVVIVIIALGRRFSRTANSGESLFSHWVLPIITVILLVFTILILGLGGKIQQEALGTLIGGISGYVLGKGLLSGQDPGAGPNA
jgi:hypothetical protein